MIQNRKKERCGKKYMVSFSNIEDQILSFLGITVNISENGMCIASSSLIPQNKKISVLIATEGEIITLSGDSKWNCKFQDSLLGTGVYINSPPKEYIKFVNRILSH